jgi:enoyl-CoA hydratase
MALRIGLVNEVVEPDSLHGRAIELAGTFAGGALAAQAMCKEAIDEGLQGSLHDGLLLEQDLFVRAFDTEDARIGLASFIEHGPGKAIFTGR